MVRFALSADTASALRAGGVGMVKEDGTGLEAATVYADANAAAQFHADRGTIDQWAEHLDAGTALGALLAATAMLDAAYVWRGTLLNDAQGLNLPRNEFVDGEGRTWTAAMQIARASDAVSLLALRLLQDPISGAANMTSERLPDYAVTYDGAKRASYPEIDAIVAGMYEAGGLGSSLRNVELVRWS